MGSVLARAKPRPRYLHLLFDSFTGFMFARRALGRIGTDLFQFVLKMAIVIAVAYYGVKAAGGCPQCSQTLRIERSLAWSVGHTAMFLIFARAHGGSNLDAAVLTFLVHLGVQWWASGIRIGAGWAADISRSEFSAREMNGTTAFRAVVQHRALRRGPWPWIYGACGRRALSGLAHPETGTCLWRPHDAHALRGILIAGFMGRFMSTIATQLNWGSSYLGGFLQAVHSTDASGKPYVNISRIATLLLVAASAFVRLNWRRSAGLEVVLEVGAGTGGVYLLRWYGGASCVE